MPPLLGVFFFRRDLRVVDNTALTQCLEHCQKHGARFVPVFVFHPDQISWKRNPYYSSPAVEFMIQCLRDLETALRRDLGTELTYYETDDDTEILRALSSVASISCVGWNTDYTPYARRRDAALIASSSELGIETVITAEDYTLHPMAQLRTKTGGIYQKFTPFYRAAMAAPAPVPASAAAAMSKQKRRMSFAFSKLNNLLSKTTLEARIRTPLGDALAVRGGRPAALVILKRLHSGAAWRDYEATRDDPSLDTGTTHLSAYLKFGCVSIREAYAAASASGGRDGALVRELYWREFYAYVAYHVPEVLRGQLKGHPNRGMKPDTDRIKWPRDTEMHLTAWKEGRTGIPLVDAGIRQMLATGYMHNRLRMIVAMFLVKDLHIDWREGERYFAQKLVDYDPASNNGGWQWCASTGVDSPLYFRVFNPWVQQERFDPKAIYIRRWVSELAGVEPRDIRRWETESDVAGVTASYPRPIVQHAEAVAITRRLYARIKVSMSPDA